MTNIDNAVHDDGGDDDDEAGDDVVDYKMNTNEVYHKVSVCLLHKVQQVAKDMLRPSFFCIFIWEGTSCKCNLLSESTQGQKQL